MYNTYWSRKNIFYEKNVKKSIKFMKSDLGLFVGLIVKFSNVDLCNFLYYVSIILPHLLSLSHVYKFDGRFENKKIKLKLLTHLFNFKSNLQQWWIQDFPDGWGC